MKNNKGITLVALVITIIVLLILAGVSISMVVGENGVLSRATNAATETSKAEAEQELGSWLMDQQTAFASKDWLDNTTLVFAKDYLAKDDKGALVTKAYSSNGYSITFKNNNINTTDSGANFSGKAQGEMTKGSETYYFEIEGAGQMGAKISTFTATKPSSWPS